MVAFSTTGMRYDGTNPAEYAYEGAIAAANAGDIRIRQSISLPCKKCCDEEDALPHVGEVFHDAAAGKTRAVEPALCALL